MTSQVLIVHLPEDRETAAYLAGDLERQGVRVATRSAGQDQGVHDASALVALLSQAGSGTGAVWAAADAAARAGRPVYVVRLGEVSTDAFAAMPVRLWVDAFGPGAQANVGQLAEHLRGLSAGAAPAWGGAPPAADHHGGGAPGRRSAGSGLWLGIGGAVLAGIIAVVAVLEITETIDIFDSSSSTSSAYNAPVNVDVNGNSVTAAAPLLDGRWSTEPGCGGMGITYSAGNRWRSEDGREGTFVFSGDTYTSYETGGPTTVMRVVRRDNNIFETEDVTDGYRATRYRCAPGAAFQSSSAGNSNLSAALSSAAAQFRARLPLRSGPTTITDVQALGSTLTMYVTLDRPVGGAWSQLDSALRRNICSGNFAGLIRQGATAVIQMQDSAGAQHSLRVSSC